MLDTCNVKSLIDLFDTIPRGLLIPDHDATRILQSGALHVEGLTEFQLHASLNEIAARNKSYRAIFRGAGFYHHYIPAVVDYLASRGEFWTAYTPYQAERSQGYLQLIFEYQSLVSGLLGMNFSNASLHDGATALADAIAMAHAQNKKRQEVLVIGQLSPIYRKVLDTTFLPRSILFKESTVDGFEDDVSAKTMAIIVCSPDFFGNILDVERITRAIKQRDPGVICIQVVQEALSLALLKSPGAAGIDIAVGEAQSFGIPLSFGGPGLGFMGVSDVKLLHRMPGRVAGITKELHGDGEGFTLTLQAREQHIRREKALSNICSNEALNALRAAIYLVSLGDSGLARLAEVNVKKTNYLKNAITKLDGYACTNAHPTFNEFAVKAPPGVINALQEKCEKRGILGPLALDCFGKKWEGIALACVTEMATIDALGDLLGAMEDAAK